MGLTLPLFVSYYPYKQFKQTLNAWHFYYALVFVITVLCGKLVVAFRAT
ncbi:hypothetical protein DB317_17060 [Vibrio cholerae]|nr:hypothetical protein DB317_17060 [Vibrio cholerae]